MVSFLIHSYPAAVCLPNSGRELGQDGLWSLGHADPGAPASIDLPSPLQDLDFTSVTIAKSKVAAGKGLASVPAKQKAAAGSGRYEAWVMRCLHYGQVLTKSLGTLAFQQWAI